MQFETSIRRKTADECAREYYELIYAEIEAAEREEYDREFGQEFRVKHPFKPDGARVHAKVIERLTREKYSQD